MSVTNKQFSIWAASMVVSLAAAFAAAGASQAGGSPARCEIAAKSSGAMAATDAPALTGGLVRYSFADKANGCGPSDTEATAMPPA